jgi:hypothetical protein
VLERREVEVLLASEVAGDERGIDACPLADVAHGGGLVAALLEQRVGGLQQRLAAGL